VRVEAESFRQQLRRQVAQKDAHFLKNAVRFANLVDQLRLAAAPPDRTPRPEPPKPNRQCATNPGNTHVAALLDEPSDLSNHAPVDELDELRLPTKQNERNQREFLLGGEARIVGHAPVIDERLGVVAITRFRDL